MAVLRTFSAARLRLEITTSHQRVKEAVSEIKAVARRDPLLAAEGAVLFLEKVSPALEQVDSSSGAIGTAVNRAVDSLVPVIQAAPADARTREGWLERLWEALQSDEIPYIEALGEHWGALCASKEVASRWADKFVGAVRLAWSPDRENRAFFPGTTACLSALFNAERYEELLELLALDRISYWPYREWGVRALIALGRKAEALRYAEASRDRHTSPAAVARSCEEILLSSGLAEEAYERYALEANEATSYSATFRAIAKKYPHKSPATILRDLVARTPGGEGKWFAAAKEAGLFEEAVELVKRSPADPRTLTRAARDFLEKNPGFALEAGFAALHWIVLGYGYDLTGADVWVAYQHTMRAAERLGRSDETLGSIRALVAGESPQRPLRIRGAEERAGNHEENRPAGSTTTKGTGF